MGFSKLFLVLICFQIQTLSSHPHIGVSEEHVDVNDGILVIGGDSGNDQSVEFWSAADPEEGSCVLPDYPRKMILGPNVNLVSGQLVACSEGSCDTFEGGEWNHLVDTMDPMRILASNAVNDDRMLLIGGVVVDPVTEWIPVDGSPAQPGPFNGDDLDSHLFGDHCTIQTAPDRIVVTGGRRGNAEEYTYDYVAEYQLTGDFTETPLTPMLNSRFGHACGVYQGVGGQQVLLVTGGTAGGIHSTYTSTEVAVYSPGSKLEWREVESGQLPSTVGLFGLEATLVDQTLYVSGGSITTSDSGDTTTTYYTSILSWDPIAESWQPAGNLAVGRHHHATVAIPSSTIAMYCQQKN